MDGYQRAFLREFGCNPREYAAHPVPLYLMTPYGVKYRFTEKEPMNMEQIKNVFIQVIEKPARKVILKRGIQAYDYMTYCNEAGCDVWGLLTSIKSISGEPLCLWLPEQYRPEGTSQYVQGVEVSSDYSGPVPEGFDVIQLPAASYLMFQGEPFEEEDFCQAIQMVQTAMERYDLSVIRSWPLTLKIPEFSWNHRDQGIYRNASGKTGCILISFTPGAGCESLRSLNRPPS